MAGGIVCTGSSHLYTISKVIPVPPRSQMVLWYLDFCTNQSSGGTLAYRILYHPVVRWYVGN
jgi:hypothetical protein